MAKENLWITEAEKKKIDKVREKIELEYTKAIFQNWIDKPLAYAIYQVWKEIDAKEKGRRTGKKGANDER